MQIYVKYFSFILKGCCYIFINLRLLISTEIMTQFVNSSLFG